MPLIISLVNTKGGCGKTTCSINIASYFAEEGYRTLLIDTDDDGDSLAWANNKNGPKPLFETIAAPDSSSLKGAIKATAGAFEIVVIDGAPHFRELATTTLAVSDLVLIPVKPSPNDIRKSGRLVKRIHEARQIKPNLNCYFLVNEAKTNTDFAKDVNNSLAHYNLPVLNARFHDRIAFVESINEGVSGLVSRDAFARFESRQLGEEISSLLGLKSPQNKKIEINPNKHVKEKTSSNRSIGS